MTLYIKMKTLQAYPEKFIVAQEIFRILWNPKFHYGVHKSLSLVKVLSHMNPLHTLTSYFF